MGSERTRHLRLVQPVEDETIDPEAAVREAYGRIMDAFAEVLTIPGVPEEEQARFRRCLFSAASVAERQPIALAQPSQESVGR